MGKLSAAKVKALLDSPGKHSDGDGLILFVREGRQASWVARFQHAGKRRDYGIGSAKLYGLAWAVRLRLSPRATIVLRVPQLHSDPAMAAP